jgi:hypothetical protein
MTIPLPTACSLLDVDRPMFNRRSSGPQSCGSELRHSQFVVRTYHGSVFCLLPFPRVPQSAFRFVDALPTEQLPTLWSPLPAENLPVPVSPQQREFVLMEETAAYSKRKQPR